MSISVMMTDDDWKLYSQWKSQELRRKACIAHECDMMDLCFIHNQPEFKCTGCYEISLPQPKKWNFYHLILTQESKNKDPSYLIERAQKIVDSKMCKVRHAEWFLEETKSGTPHIHMMLASPKYLRKQVLTKLMKNPRSYKLIRKSDRLSQINCFEYVRKDNKPLGVKGDLKSLLVE